MLRNSPFSKWPPIFNGISSERFPLATEPITCAISIVGCTRSEINVFNESTPLCQEPFAFGKGIRSVSLPCLPMILPALVNSFIIFSLSSMISLSVSAILPLMPSSSEGMRTEKFPFFTSVRTLSNKLLSIPSEGNFPLLFANECFRFGPRLTSAMSSDWLFIKCWLR